jgi:hypothetical protein
MTRWYRGRELPVSGLGMFSDLRGITDNPATDWSLFGVNALPGC